MDIFLYLLIFIVLSILFMIFPRLSKKGEVYAFLDRYFTHRGLFNNEGDAPENSLKAFQNAVDSNYGIEFDIKLTADDIVVVFHDSDTKRALGCEGKIIEYRYDQLIDKHLFSSEQSIPTLKETLELIDGKIPIIVEFKSEGSNSILCEKAQELLDKYDGPYVVESFDPLIMKWYKKNRRDILRGQLSAKVLHSKYAMLNYILRNLALNFLSRPDFIAYEKNVGGLVYNILRAMKVPYVSYTIKSEDELRIAKSKFDAHIFEGFIPSEDNVNE